MVLNLLDNAIKYTPRGAAAHLSPDRSGLHARLAVTDEGPGIGTTVEITLPASTDLLDQPAATPMEIPSMRHETPEISVIVPAFDEAESLPVLHRELGRALAPLGRPYEILLVDDGSTDATLAVAEELAREDRRVRTLSHRHNAGQSAALASGWRAARGTIYVMLDADLQNDPADIPRLLAVLDDPSGPWDVVTGVRTHRQDDLVRKLSSRIANGVRNRLTGDSITDVGCTLRVCRAHLFDHLPWFDGMHRFLPTLLKLQGARVRELPVHHRPRRFGCPKYGISNRLWRGLIDLFAVRWMQRRWIEAHLTLEADPARQREPEMVHRASFPAPSAAGGGFRSSREAELQ